MSRWNLPDPVALHAYGQPERLACHDVATGRRWRYDEFDRDIQRTVALLADRYGIVHGDRVATVANNGADLLLLNLAAERLGAIFVPLNYRLSTLELNAILDDCRPALVATDRFDRLPTPSSGYAVHVADLAREIAACEPAEHGPRPPNDETKIILYTSGTSGRPKGVMITGDNIRATALNFGVPGRVAWNSVFLCDAPMFHVIGLLPSMRATLMFGGALHISPGFDPERTNRLLADADIGVTHYFCVPKMASMLAEQANFEPSRWQHLQALFTGGSPISPAEVNGWLERGIKVSNGFGMTEAGTIMHVPLNRQLMAETAGSVGLPAPFLEVRLVDEHDNDVAAGEPGEILVRGANVTPGYWNRPEETAKALTADGWLRTGDIGQADVRGHITLKDRKKDMFISGGENVFPAEVENALMDHPDVVEAAVVGVADPGWGEIGHAYVVLRAGSPADPDTLAQHCQQRLAGYKTPKRFVIVEELPRNAAGKLMKQVLKTPGHGPDSSPG
ncbi:AMP-binding protein [Salinisphaera hydrothermalis]|uniref:Acyl-CoA synthetase n=1 Tax=Salinisphaera hydrothermalis (strain C41B8) TaxID=1304275 RepID=A0A084IPJ6_SALHC|nr:AMP-binding protein [Salinisphaera hydrothermalis]KEZ78630.1 acyl-CoA synthetase [Salinisphaera hydrothermalis C41B8]